MINSVQEAYYHSVPSQKKPIAFYAYPGNPPHIGETIKEFARSINNQKKVEIRTWHDMQVAGLKITTQIIKKIDQCDIFCCDLTYLNNNVLFELGYAIAKRKKVFISVDSNIIDTHKRYTSLAPLTNIAYTSYTNSQDLKNRFEESKVYSKDYESLAEQIKLFDSPESLEIFYLKSAADTESSFKLTEALGEFPFQVITDDPMEAPADSLMWYGNNIAGCIAFVAHFMSSEQIGNSSHNYKTSLISGMSFGYGKPTFLLAHSPFEVPSDIPDFVKVHEIASQARAFARSWMTSLVHNKSQLEKQRREYDLSQEKNNALKRLNIGQYTAENENDDLYRYFVETGAYNEVISGRQTIFVGRKGTGKSANLYSAARHFERDKRNLVIIIKPVGYEISGLISILNSAKEVEYRGFFVESLWKYLLYSEIARSIDNKFKENPGRSTDKDEEDLINFSVNNADIFSESFTERLRKIIKEINIVDYVDSGGANVMEYLGIKLHSNFIRTLKKKLAPILKEYNTVVILIDNLDKGWDSGINVEQVSEILFGLLSVSRQLPNEIRQDTKDGNSINFKTTLFLRSDIYTHVLKSARERDKLEVQHMEWNDFDVLGRVLDERLVKDFPRQSPSEVWSRFFLPSIDNLSPRDFILKNIRPRPRDAIYLLKTAINNSISKGHSRVEGDDISNALLTYSKWVYRSLVDEDDPSKNHMEDVLYEFIDDKIIYLESEVASILSKVISDPVVCEEYLNLLFDSHFLEIEYNKDNFTISDNPDDRKMLLIAVRKRAAKNNTEVKFRVNKPFHRVLYIVD
jgi:hypothetical protein